MLLSLIPYQAILAVIISLLVIIISFFKWNYTYWKRKNVPFIEPSIPFGSLPNPFTRKVPMYLFFKGFYDHFKSLGLKHGGIYVFSNPIYIPVDPEYVKSIFSADFQHFTDRGLFCNEKDDPLSAHLFSMSGQKWRNLRQKLTPTFSSGKMKMMFSTLYECSLQMKDALDTAIAIGKPIDIKEISSCYTTDVIGSCGFGLECNSFKNPDAEFRRYGKKIISPNRLRNIFISMSFNFPNLFKALRIRVTSRDVHDFFTNIVTKTVSYREQNNFERNDFLQLLIDLKNRGKSITMQEIISQCFIFFFAGFETSSSTMTMLLYELAVNQDIQEKTRKEIQTVLAKYNGKVSYDSIREMKYLEQVVDETLRKYPIVPALPRVVTKDYKIPNEDIVLEKGQKLWISTYGFHYDPEYFPDPDKFDPERFSEENKNKIPPFVYMPFGHGPRTCIGLRIAQLQIKVGMVTLLQNYKLRLNMNTPKSIEYNPNVFVLTAQGTILFDAEKIV